MLGPLLQQWGVRTSSSFPCLLPKWGWGALRVGSLYAVRVELCPEFRQEGWLTVCPPFGGVGCKGHAHYPAFTPDLWFFFPAPQRWHLDPFDLFVSCCPESAPAVLVHIVTSGPLQFFFFFSFGLRREVQALHQCGKGSPVPACFSMMTKIKITKKTSAIRAQKLLWIGSCKSKIKLLIEERNSRW